MSSPDLQTLHPLIEGYLSYLDKVGRKSARTIVDALTSEERAKAYAHDESLPRAGAPAGAPWRPAPTPSQAGRRGWNGRGRV